jgi:rRNA-processing protein FCF1
MHLLDIVIFSCASKSHYWLTKDMCIIVDANLCAEIFKNTKSNTYKPLQEAIFSNRLMIVHGGKLTQEYEKAGVLSIVAVLAQSGKAFKVSDAEIDLQLTQISQQCTSNDEHIVALARANRKLAHVLCTNDKALQNDFKNKSLIDNPRGTIYSNTRHKNSLANC